MLYGIILSQGSDKTYVCCLLEVLWAVVQVSSYNSSYRPTLIGGGTIFKVGGGGAIFFSEVKNGGQNRRVSAHRRTCATQGGV